MKVQLVLIISFMVLAGVEKSFAVNCSGTEPFWGAEVTQNQVSIETVGSNAPKLFEVTSVSGASGYTADFLQIYSNQNGPIAIITSNQCNDSMSDFIYPQEVILFTGSETLYGCCGNPINQSDVDI